MSGDEVLRYLEWRLTKIETDHVFVRSMLLTGPSLRRWCLVRGETRAQTRQHRSSCQGCHTCCVHRRHRDVAEWCAFLDQAGLVLRHRSIDMTADDEKVDVALLGKQIAQPWPGVIR